MEAKFDFRIFPTYDEVVNGIRSLIGYDWPKFNENDNIDNHIKKVTQIFDKHFKVLSDLIYFHNEQFPLPLNFFRARTFDTFQDTSLFCEYKYKPIHLTKEIQRCNFPFKPVFYCSNDACTALLEILRDQPFDKENIYLISKWTIINDFNTKVIPYLFGDLPEENYYKLFGNKALDRIPDIFENNLSDDQVKGLRLYYNYLASIFTENNYSISAALAHRMLYANYNFRADLFLYPSVQTGKKSINIAIHPNYVDTSMKLKRIYKVKINKINKQIGECNVTISKYADIENSLIMWKEIDPDNKNYKNIIRNDFNYKGNFIFKSNIDNAKPNKIIF
jgi:hypothetical protein